MDKGRGGIAQRGLNRDRVAGTVVETELVPLPVCDAALPDGFLTKLTGADAVGTLNGVEAAQLGERQQAVDERGNAVGILLYVLACLPAYLERQVHVWL